MKAARIALALSVLLPTVAGSVWGQTATPYTGVVTGSEVYVRSGPGMGSYPVTKLSAPRRVNVVEKLSGDWLAIQPVQGCYGVINAQFVQPDATGKIGTITGENVLVRAAGSLRRKNFDNPLGKRNRGDRVRIIGRVVGGDGKIEWYVIKPPDDMRFYISARFVRSADESATPEPADEPVAPDAPAAATPSATVISAAPVKQEIDALRKIRALEKELVAESAKPVEKRDFQNILTRAKSIQLPKNSRFAPIYDSLMEYLQEEIALVDKAQATNQMVDEVLRKAAAKSAAAQATKTPSATPEVPEGDRPFDLEGVLTVSALYTIADPSQPKRYVVRRPNTKAVVGYVQSSKGSVPLEEYEGKHIGIRGTMTFDKRISIKILEAESVTLLQEDTLSDQTKPKQAEPAEPELEPTESEPTESETPEAPATDEPEEPKTPEPVTPEPTKPEPAEPPQPEPLTPEPEPQPLEPKTPAEPVVEKPLPAEPVKAAEPEPAEPDTPVDVEPKNIEPAKKPQPLEPKPAPVAPKPKPADVEPTEPVKPRPVVPAKKPAPVEPEPVPAAPVEPEPVPAAPEPEPTVEPVEPEPTPTAPEPESSEEPQPVKKPPVPPEPDVITLDEEPEPTPVEPVKTEPAKIQPMEIKPIDVAPTEIDSDVVKETPPTPKEPGKVAAQPETPVKSPVAPKKASEPQPMPADETPQPEWNIYKVKSTEGEVEVEWD